MKAYGSYQNVHEEEAFSKPSNVRGPEVLKLLSQRTGFDNVRLESE